MSNIIGLGIDATDIPRIAAAIERYGERFIHRVFTDGEIAYCTPATPAGDPFRRAIRRQGSRDEGARHRSHAGGAVARRRGRPPRRSAATAVSRRRRAAICRDGRTIVAADHHALGNARPRAGPAARARNARLSFEPLRRRLSRPRRRDRWLRKPQLASHDLRATPPRSTSVGASLDSSAQYDARRPPRRRRQEKECT